jgi:site-specific recombinase XerD
LKEIAVAIKLDRICEVKQLQGKEMITEYLPLYEIISFHFARYTYITELLNSGLAPIHVQNNVGHNKLETTLDYNRDIQKDRLKETILIQERIA